MKKILLIACLIVLTKLCFSQDKIVTQKNDTLTCKIIDVSKNTIKYKLPNEDSTNSIKKSKVGQIIFANGRTEKITIKEKTIEEYPSGDGGITRRKTITGTIR